MLISKGDRLENMETRLREVVRNMKRAVESGDPWAVDYWEAARAKQAAAIERLRGKDVAELGDVKSAFREAGIFVEGTWAQTAEAAGMQSSKAADAAIAEMRRAKAGIDSLDMVSSGVALMDELGIGMNARAPFVVATADRIAATIAARLRGPGAAAAASGVASGGGGGGNTFNIGNVYGGKAGTRQLQSELDKATRPTQRNRRHNNLPEG
jgi:acyl carrier protein